MRSGSKFLLFTMIILTSVLLIISTQPNEENIVLSQVETTITRKVVKSYETFSSPTVTISRSVAVESAPKAPLILDDGVNTAEISQQLETPENIAQVGSTAQPTPTLQPTSTPLADRPVGVPENYVGIHAVVWTTFYVPEACHLKRTLPDGSTEWSEWFLKWVEDGEVRSGAEPGSYNYLINCSSKEGWHLMGGMNIFEDCDGSCFGIAAACPREITLFYGDGSKSGFVVEFPDAPGIGSRRCLDTGGSISLLDPWINENGELVLSFDIDVLVPMFDPSGANYADDYTPANWGSSYYSAKLWIPEEDAQNMVQILSNPYGTPTPPIANQPYAQE